MNAIAAAHRCKVEQTFEYLSYPSLVNDPIWRICQQLGRLWGRKRWWKPSPRPTKDYQTPIIRAYNGQGLHVLIGVRNREYGSGEAAHNPKCG